MRILALIIIFPPPLLLIRRLESLAHLLDMVEHLFLKGL